MVLLAVLASATACAQPGATADDPTEGTATLASAAPVVVYAGLDDTGQAVRVDAYVAEIVEGDGTCVVEMTNGDERVEAESVAVPDATTTWCEEATFAVADLSPGSWQVVVGYSSPTSEGRSESLEVQVP